MIAERTGLLLALTLLGPAGCMASTQSAHGSRAESMSVALQNLTGRDVCGVYVAHAGTENFSAELLGVAADRDNIISGNEEEEINVRPGTYDVRIQNCDGRTYLQRNVSFGGSNRVVLDPPR